MPAFLYVTIPPIPTLKSPYLPIRQNVSQLPEKAWKTPRNGIPFKLSSTLKISSVASRAWMITGKSHQIRAQLSEAGYPLLGDYKYGSRSVNDRYKAEYGLESQLLHAYRLEFPSLEGALKGLGGKTVEAPMPSIFSEILGD